MTDGYNPGVPLGAVTAIHIVSSDSVILDLTAAIAGDVVGGMAWDVLAGTWTEREKQRQESAKYEPGQ